MQNEFSDYFDKKIKQLFKTALQQWLSVLNLIDSTRVQMGLQYSCDTFDAKVKFINSLGRSRHSFYDLKKSSIEIYRGYEDLRPKSRKEYVAPTPQSSYSSNKLLGVITHELGHGFGLGDVYLDESIHPQAGQLYKSIMFSSDNPIAFDDKIGLAASYSLNSGLRPSPGFDLGELTRDELLLLFVAGLQHRGHERCSHFFTFELRHLWIALGREYGTKFLIDFVNRANHLSDKSLRYFSSAYRFDFNHYDRAENVRPLSGYFNPWNDLSDRMISEWDLTQTSIKSNEKNLLCETPSYIYWIWDVIENLYSKSEKVPWHHAYNRGRELANKSDNWLTKEAHALYESYDFLQKMFFLNGVRKSGQWDNPIYRPIDFFEEPFIKRPLFHAMYSPLPKVRKLIVNGRNQESYVDESIRRENGVIKFGEYTCVIGYAWQGGVCKPSRWEYDHTIYSLSFPTGKIEDGDFELKSLHQKNKKDYFKCIDSIRYLGYFEPEKISNCNDDL